MSVECLSCHKAVNPDNDGRLPPWCPSCGGDLKKPSSATAARKAPPPLPADETLPEWENVPVAAARTQDDTLPSWERPPSPRETRTRNYEERRADPVSWREPSAEPCSGEAALAAACAGDETLAGSVARVKHAHRERQQRQNKNRLAGAAVMFLGILIIALILGLNAVTVQAPDGGRIVVPVKLGVVGLVLFGVGAVTLLSGQDVMNLNTRELHDVCVGPDGVSRTLAPDAGPSALEPGWSIPWTSITSLVYIEDPILGKASRTLEVHTKTGVVERVRIAATVARVQLAAAAECWGPGLHVIAGADWAKSH